MDKLILKLWLDTKVEHLEFIRDAGITRDLKSVEDQIKLLNELNYLFKLDDAPIKDLQFH